MSRAVPVGRGGATVVEALVALLLGLLLLQLGLGGLARARDAQLRITRQADVLRTARIARWVLRRELGMGRPGVDWTVHPPDSGTVRAFRGTAVLCRDGAGVGGAGPPVSVAYRGMREPEPAKDSVLLVGGGGATVVAAVVASAPAPPAGCPLAATATSAGWRLLRWTLDPAPGPDAVVGRLFERGSYHLSGGALRYRRGAGGRQPLSPAVLATPPGGFESGAAGTAVTLRAEGGGAAGRRTLPLHPSGG